MITKTSLFRFRFAALAVALPLAATGMLPGSRARKRWLAGAVAVAALTASSAALLPGQPARPASAGTSPIQHIVVLDLENHSFDNVLGFWCQTSPRCGPGDAMPLTVTLSNRTVVTPSADPDVVPSVNHSMASQLAAMDGGKMDGWQNTVGGGCNSAHAYRCISGYQASQVPNIVSLATSFAMNDRFLSLKDSPSWGGHMYAVAATTDGFTGDNPVAAPGTAAGPGWGCDSNLVAKWSAGGPFQPSCVPDFALGLPNGGAFEPTKALFVPTIMDRLDTAGLSWRIYGATSAGPPGTQSQNGYIWSVCPTFAECLDSGQHANLVDSGQFLTDAAAGTLPNFSLITACGSRNLAASPPQRVLHDRLRQLNRPSRLHSGDQPRMVLHGPADHLDDYGGFYDSQAPGGEPGRDAAGDSGCR